MSWSFNCATCKSKDVQAGAHEVYCLNCGCLTDENGVAVPSEVQFSRENPL